MPHEKLDREFVREEHPANRPIEPEDPLMMTGDCPEGDPGYMLTSIVEEYARMGWGAEQIMALFDKPFFRATNGLKKLFGEAETKRRIYETLSRCGVLHVRMESDLPAQDAVPCAGHSSCSGAENQASTAE